MRERGDAKREALAFFVLTTLAFSIRAQPPKAGPGNDQSSILAAADQLRLSGRAADLQAAIGRYRDAAETYRGAGDQRGQAQALFGMALAFDGLSKKHDAITTYSLALELFRGVHDQDGEAGTLIQLGLDYDYLGDRKRATAYAADALAVVTGKPCAARANVLTHAGQIYDRAGQKERALELFEQALPLEREAHNQRGEATALSGLGVLYYSMGRVPEALDNLERALALYRATHDLRDEAYTLTSMGAAYYSVDDYSRARGYFEEAEGKWEECGERSGESANLHNLASTLERMGELQDAIRNYNLALPLHRASGYRMGEANTLTSLGRLHAELGDYSSALAFYRQALPAHQATANRQGEAATLENMSGVYAAQGRHREALELLLRALPLRRAIEDTPGQAGALNRIGLEYANLGDQDRARRFANDGLGLFIAIGSPRGQALCRSTLALSRSLGGERHEAIDEYRAAAELFQKAGDAPGEASARYGMAREWSRLDELEKARGDAEAALAIAESLRSRVLSPELRSFYIASVRDVFDLEIDVLMRLHRRQPRAGFAAAALETVERSRARSLAGMLSERQIDVREGVDPALLERERSLGRLLDATADRHLALLITRPEESRKTAQTLARVTADYRAVEAEIRSESPRFAALEQPAPLSLAGIQREVLDRDTRLLVYSLGAERSYAWVVSPDSVAAYVLPPRAEIEAASERFYRMLSSGDAGAEEAGRRLAAMALAPLAERLAAGRVAIVADGALQYVPFAALPLAGGAGYAPSVTRLEVVNLPSASALGLLRRGALDRSKPARTLAVVADPVFRRDDPRVDGGSGTAGDTPAARGIDLELPRLPGTRREAEAVLRLVPPALRTAALGFDANLAELRAPAIADSRIVHLATHAFVDSESAESSGIVFSLVDRNGRPRQGILHLADLYNLRWKSDLVVLSACRTALGKEVSGEGLIGFTRGFLYSGVPRVAASLWKIDDSQTVELMRDFYEAMLGPRRMAPAAALRAAQRKAIAAGRPLASWAAFLLVGDWR